MIGGYGKDWTVKRERIAKVSSSVLAHLYMMLMCISRTIPNSARERSLNCKILMHLCIGTELLASNKVSQMVIRYDMRSTYFRWVLLPS